MRLNVEKVSFENAQLIFSLSFSFSSHFVLVNSLYAQESAANEKSCRSR